MFILGVDLPFVSKLNFAPDQWQITWSFTACKLLCVVYIRFHLCKTDVFLPGFHILDVILYYGDQVCTVLWIRYSVPQWKRILLVLNTHVKQVCNQMSWKITHQYLFKRVLFGPFGCALLDSMKQTGVQMFYLNVQKYTMHVKTR